MKYIFLRIFAVEVEVPPILEATGAAPSRTTRQEYLEKVFSDKISFEHWTQDFLYVPVSKEELPDGVVCTGRVGAQKLQKSNAAPDKLLEPETKMTWQASNFLLDTRNFKDGQKVAMQFRVEVGKPLSILNSLIREINDSNPDSGWLLEVNQVTQRQSFWEAANARKGEITKAEFNYVTPNVLGIRSTLNARLQEYKDNENANEVTVTLSNAKGNLNLDSQEVKDAVEYTSEGGGSSKLKVGAEVIFDSEDDEKAVTVETEDTSGLSTKDALKRLIGKLFS